MSIKFRDSSCINNSCVPSSLNTDRLYQKYGKIAVEPFSGANLGEDRKNTQHKKHQLPIALPPPFEKNPSAIPLTQIDKTFLDANNLMQTQPEKSCRLFAQAGKNYANAFMLRKASECYNKAIEIQRALLTRSLSYITNPTFFSDDICLHTLSSHITSSHQTKQSDSVLHFPNECNKENTFFVAPQIEDLIRRLIFLFKARLYLSRILRPFNKKFSAKLLLDAIACIFPQNILDALTDKIRNEETLPDFLNTQHQCRAMVIRLDSVFRLANLKNRSDLREDKLDYQVAIVLEEIAGLLSETELDYASIVLYELAYQLRSLFGESAKVIKNLNTLALLYAHVGQTILQIQCLEEAICLDRGNIGSEANLNILIELLELAILSDDLIRIQKLLSIIDEEADGFGRKQNISHEKWKLLDLTARLAHAYICIDVDAIDALEVEINTIHKTSLPLLEIIKHRIFLHEQVS
ncbi:uncharacterized protein LOC126304665 [Schistocerca gregaria]|uniref:uncharacterized protein LOC126304665 n=1 Tax=Schistocerca gregaria TaxID=7010 RepID=UPI00211ECC35|nr:uncharacterized protein LOC126304665 [Schistocerca gregaria]